MAWRVAEVNGTSGSAWRVAKLSGQITVAASSWRVANLSGSITTASWQVAKVSGAVSSGTTPVLATYSAVTVDPVLPVLVVAATTNNVVPDFYTFTSPGVTFQVSGNSALFYPPGSIDGSTITVTVTATSGSNTSTPVSITVQIRKGTIFRVDGAGTYIAVAPFTVPPNAIRQINPTGVTPPASLFATSGPVISGTTQVGNVLTTSNGIWNATPDAYTYQWRRDGAAIAGAVAKTYTLVSADSGHTISCAVTASKANYTSQTSVANGVVVSTAATPTLTVVTTPSISGTPAVGSTLTAVPGTWNATPDSFTYQWLSGATPIVGATSTTYVPVAGDAGATLTVSVTAIKAGYTNGMSASTGVTIPSSTGGGGGYVSGFFVGKTASAALSRSGQSGFTISGLSFSNLAAGTTCISLTNCNNFVLEQNDFDTVPECILLTNCYNFKIQYNRARNITGPHTRTGAHAGNFVQAQQCSGPGQYYGYNKIRDGDTEDVFSIYQSNGTSDSPIILEFNRIENETYTSTSGSGMLLGDGNGSWQVARNNFMLNPGQVGIGVGGGSNITLDSNQIWGDQTAYSNIGMYVANYSSASSMSNIAVTNNKVFFKNKSGTVNGFFNDGFATNVTNTGNNFTSQGTLVKSDLVVSLVQGQ